MRNRRTLAVRAYNGECLDRDTLRRIVPAAFAEQKHESRSERYKFLSTVQLIDALEGVGLVPVYARQAGSRSEGMRGFAEHVIRFRHRYNLTLTTLNDTAVEVCLRNSHNGRTLDDIFAGVFRLWCLNGAVTPVSDSTSEFKTKHLGNAATIDRVIAKSLEVVANTSKIMDEIASWRSLELDDEQILDFATTAAMIRFGDDQKVNPETLLKIRREADLPVDLWTIFNRVQENAIRGGLPYVNANAQVRHTREVRSIAVDLDVNRALWQLARDTYASLV